MVAIRLPRPAGVYLPNSPPRSVTSDMISSPLSAGFNFDSAILTPSSLPALEYISSKLQQKMMHVTLVVGRGKPYPTGQPSDLIVIPSTPLDQSEWRLLSRTMAKAALKFSLGQSWTNALNRSQYERQANDYLIQQSILQNEVVFSREGLTLLNVDRIYTFKRRLCILSGKTAPLKESYMTSCLRLLHRTIQDVHGRPFSKAFFHRIYEQLDVRDELLAQVADAYKKQYGQDGIVLPPPQPKVKVMPEPTERKSPLRPMRVRKQPAAPRSATVPTKRGPKTPLSASDVTPITREEWNHVVGPDFHQSKPTVTKWTPSPIALAVA